MSPLLTTGRFRSILNWCLIAWTKRSTILVETSLGLTPLMCRAGAPLRRSHTRTAQSGPDEIANLPSGETATLLNRLLTSAEATICRACNPVERFHKDKILSFAVTTNDSSGWGVRWVHAPDMSISLITLSRSEERRVGK